MLTYALLPQVAEKFFKARKEGTLNAPAAPVVEAKAAPAEKAAAEGDDEELVAVLSAAVAATEGGAPSDYRITGFRQVSPWVLYERLNR